ncbi:MAG: PstS family phosphate ABC transporter substrate-binding protein [Bacteroidales bacterium]|nr:PstS family phosphate ABC transporter substrate-binding protein [Bacteroidales bacterium]
MKTIKLISIVFLIVILFSCNNNKSTGSSDDLKGTVTISGAFALYPMTTRWAEEFRKIHPDVRINISAGGAGKGMTDALSGIVDLGMFSRGISDVEKAKGVWWIAVTKDAVLPTINSKNPAIDLVKKCGFNQDIFIKLYLNWEIKTWSQLFDNEITDNSDINIYTRADACGAAQMWGAYLGKNQEALMGIGIYGDPGMADAVKSDIYGIGYNNVIYIYDINTRKKHEGLDIIPIDINNNGLIDDDENFYDTLDDIMKAIETEKYPSPPARELYFVAKEKPTNKIVIEFLKWIVTDGQAFVKEGGYVQLSEENLSKERSKITE